jgi:hypothetical protein
MSWAGDSSVFEPVAAVVCLGVLMLLLRWAFGGPSRSLVARRARIGDAHEYGLLVPVLTPATPAEAETARRRLAGAGVTATVVATTGGQRVMVFPEDLDRARRALDGPTGPAA